MGFPSGAFAGPLDAALQMMDAQALAATGDSTLNADLGEGFEPKPIAAMGLLVNVTTIDHTTGNETYQFNVQESADGNTWTDTGLTVTVSPLAVSQVLKVVGVTKRYLKLVWTLAGTSPVITASAWIVRV